MALITENGWPQVNSNAIVRAIVPGTADVRAEIRAGIPATILNAWLSWYHKNVERIDRYKPRDYWGWSATNEVWNSNHLSGTAVDLCATQYPWGVDASANMPASRIAKIREGLRLFEGTIFWGQDWARKDPMHYQLNFREGDPRNAAFVKKLEDGYLGIYGPEKKGDAPMSAAEVADIKDFITKFVGPIGSDVKDIREQLCGEGQRNAGQYKGWKQLGGKTLVDAVAELLKGGK